MITFSSFLLKNFFDENLDFLTNAKVQKIQQPSRKELILHLRNHSETKKLYININPSFFHVCFANNESLALRETKIPKAPPMFCMLLRKYIENAKIIRADIPDYERILELYFENYNEIGEKIELCLAIELMGKHSNIILYNTENNIILGCIHNVGEEKSQIRELSGGLPYIYPPKKEKKDLLKTTEAKFEVLKNNAQNTFYYITFNMLADTDYDYKKLIDILNNPKIFVSKDEISYTQKDETFKEFNFNSAIDFYWSKCQNEAILKNLKTNLKSLIDRKIKKQQKIINKINEENQKSKDFETNKLYGDLILSNIYRIKPGDKVLSAEDFQTEKEVKIKLDENLTPSQNAQKYYKLYTKLKKAKEYSQKRFEEAEDYLNYLKEADLSVDLIENLMELKKYKTLFNNQNPVNKTKYFNNIEKIKINDFDVYIGKNHFQNDYLLSKIAAADDIWLHLKDMPSAHIIIKKQEIPIDEKTIFECAKLVKSYSKAKNSSKVCVIYTQKKFVRKIPKSKYGLVNYREEKEIVLD